MPFSPPSSLATSQHLGHAGRDNALLFQPPKSPASISTTPTIATANDYFSAAHSSRKRHRPDSAHSRDDNHARTPWAETPAWGQCATPSDGIFSGAYGQHSDLINDRYRLADGFDTPSLRTTTRLEQLTVNEQDFRRRLRDEDMGNSIRADCVPLFGPLARERNGVARAVPPPAVAGEHSPTTWTSLAFGIVGKMFNFGSTVIRGFYAGDGRGYDLQTHSRPGSDVLEHSSGRTSTPLPGAWIQDEFLGDFEQDSPSFAHQLSPTRPVNKRRQTDRDNWVLIGTPDLETAPTSPKRKVSSNSVPRSSLLARPQVSRASSRKSIAPVPRRTASYVGANGSPTQHSLPPLQQSPHARRASVAPTRSPHRRADSAGDGAWMSPEAERYAKRQAKQERAADKAMTSMGRRMEEMIRQAQQALGTKFSVEGDPDMEDEGFVDDEW